MSQTSTGEIRATYTIHFYNSHFMALDPEEHCECGLVDDSQMVWFPGWEGIVEFSLKPMVAGLESPTLETHGAGGRYSPFCMIYRIAESGMGSALPGLDGEMN